MSRQTPPFQLDEHSEAGEDVRLKYRYMDLRRPEMQDKLRARVAVASEVRHVTWKSRDTGSGDTDPIARHAGRRPRLSGAEPYAPGQFFALPQSPQVYKQLLMMSGMDKLLSDRALLS